MKFFLFLTSVVMTQCDKGDSGIEVKDLFSAIQSGRSESSEQTELEMVSQVQNATVDALRGQAQEFVKDIRSKLRMRRQVVKGLGKLDYKWNDGVFYTFNTSDNMVQKVFKLGIKVWTDITCIDFVEDENAKDKVVVVKGHGSWSAIGRQGGDQHLSLDGVLTEGSAVHEIGHVLGLYHTMQRYDRDSYIEVAFRNMKASSRSITEFDKVNLSQADVYGLTYDYGSIMHYNELSESANRRPTIYSKDPYYQKTMGSDLISFSDILMINQHYECNEKCNKSTSAKCANEGFPHPRNCSICVCPGGYGGTLCDQRPPGCGSDLIATVEKQTVSYTLGAKYELRDHFEFCNYMITAPKGKKTEVDVRLFSPSHDNAGCTRGGVEIKTQQDQKLTGYRFCSMDGSDGPKVANSSRLPVIIYNRFSALRVALTYRYIN